MLYRDNYLSEIKNILYIEKYMNRYFRFLNICLKINSKSKFNEPKVIHHIFPRSLFLEFSNLKVYEWNSIELTERQHLIAHKILAKVFFKKMQYALDKMLGK